MSVMDEKLVQRISPLKLLWAVCMWLLFFPFILLWIMFSYIAMGLGKALSFIDTLEVREWRWEKKET